MADGAMAGQATEAKPKLIYSAMADVMQDIEAIKKSRTNQGQNFRFRGVDDVYAEVHRVFAKHRVFMTAKVLAREHQDRPTGSGKSQMWSVVHMRYRFHATDGSRVCTEAIGEALDMGDKSCGKSQSYAHKVALLQAFAIPVEDIEDPDRDSPQMGRKQQGQSQKPPPASKPPQNEPPPAQPAAPASAGSTDLAPDAVYTETASQKSRLRELVKLHAEKDHSADRELLLAISAACKGKTLRDLPTVVRGALVAKGVTLKAAT